MTNQILFVKFQAIACLTVNYVISIEDSLLKEEFYNELLFHNYSKLLLVYKIYTQLWMYIQERKYKNEIYI